LSKRRSPIQDIVPRYNSCIVNMKFKINAKPAKRLVQGLNIKKMRDVTFDFNTVEDCNEAANMLHSQLSYDWRFNDRCIVLYVENLGSNFENAYRICKMCGGRPRN